MTQKQCILVGLPLSGKSTFIGALWHVVEGNEIDSEYKISALPSDREYLNGLRDSWLSCNPPERNKTELVHTITLKVISKKGSECDFIFPDVAGELFENQFDSRRIKNEHREIIEESKGILLFVNPDTLVRPFTINEAAGMVLDEDKEDRANEEAGKEWNYKDAPTQVVIVDLLQMISELTKPTQVAVIISAWDEIINSEEDETRKQKPEDWLENSMPLLHQYLKTNEDLFKHTCFGISAQGGKYEDDNTALHNVENQSERIKVQFGTKISNDISLPIKWILDE